MELTKSIFNFCMIAGVIQGIIFLFYTSFSKRSGDKAMIYLNLLVLSLTLNNIQIPIIDTFLANANYFINSLHIPFYLLTLPMFYAFMVHYLKVEQKISDFFALGIGLFFVECLLRLVFYFNYYTVHESIVIAQYAQIEEIFNATFCLFLFTKAAFLVFNRSKLYTYVLTFDKIRWLKTFVVLGALVLLFWIIAIILNFENVVNPKIYIYYPLRLSSSILLYWIGYQGFRRYTVLNERIDIRKTIKTKTVQKINKISEEDETEIADNDNINSKSIAKFQEIESYLLGTNSYLDEEFSIKKLAEYINLSENTVSKIIKQNTNKNFSDYINKYRILKAKEFLKDPNFEIYTIESIGLECGFNSKSNFYMAFKKFADSTPHEYRMLK